MEDEGGEILMLKGRPPIKLPIAVRRMISIRMESCSERRSSPPIARKRPSLHQARPPIFTEGIVIITLRVGLPSRRVRASFMMDV